MQIYSVSQVTRYLKELLETDDLLQDVWVAGEISNLSRSPAGHTYFTMKDGASQMRCVMFRGHYASGSGGHFLANGAAIIAHGRVSIYDVQGAYQLYVDFVQPEGIGLLHLRYEALKAQLEQEGLFDEARKRPLPLFPGRIGVATSPTGAVVHDIITVLRRRFPLVDVVISPCLVQGDDAAADICRAIQVLNEWVSVDLIILARGGGSLEDLWPFNEEAVARAVFASRTPVITGIGHETDFTIADWVADRRAPTPSVAAEIAVPDHKLFGHQIATYERRMMQALRARFVERRVSLERSTAHLRRVSPVHVVERQQQRVDDLARSATLAIKHVLSLEAEKLRSVVRQLDALNPLRVLERGYSICWHETSGRAVTRVSQVGSGDHLLVQVSDGAIHSRVTEA